MTRVMKRIFLGSIATETNCFSPLRADFQDFLDGFYVPPGKHPATPTLCSAIYPVARRRASEFEWELIEGTATWAEPSGIINHQTWLSLRDNLLAELENAMPVDIVLLGLHGAMISQNQHDCEGDLLELVRAMTGPEIVIGVTVDPHSHLSARMVNNCDLLIAFKEFPHTDFVATAEDLVELAQQTSLGLVNPQISVFDVKMIDVLPTNFEPVQSFVARMKALEKLDFVASISLIHGFLAGDTPDLGAKVVVITNAEKTKGDQLARELGMQLYALRGTTRPNYIDPSEALRRAAMIDKGPVLIADVWDNPGGGVPGDSTKLTKIAVDMGLNGVAVGSIWDPIAVRLCKAAGEGSIIPLRFGAKTSLTAGDPIDAEVKVTKIVEDATQNFGDSIVSVGDAVTIRFEGIEVILNEKRCQTYSPSLFTNLGINPVHQKILIVKSTNHFFDAFAPIVTEVFYASVDGIYPHDPRNSNFKKLNRAIWPMHLNPHSNSN